VNRSSVVADNDSVSSRLTARVRAVLPTGRLLPDEVWQRRHTVIVRIALIQAVLLGLVALVRGEAPLLALAEAAVVAAPVAVAVLPAPREARGIRAAAATLSLMAGCVLLVYLMDGLTEAHFLFFVMVGLVSLYQDWAPFGVALLVVLTHHGVAGMLFPHSVFGHDQAQEQPWVWAGVHGAFVLAASLANLAAWRLNEQQGLRDPLTGLANRTHVVEAADRLLAGPGPVSVLVIDVDDFKDLNDARGHAAGDQLLVEVGDRLRRCVTTGDAIARLGGDEFAVVLSGDADAGRRVGEQMLAALATPVLIDGRPVGVHASIGLADSTTAGDRTALTLLRNADLAMYMAKAGGKNRLVLYADGMAQAAQTKVELLEDLVTATAAGQLAVHYQPVISLDYGRITGYEALLRWQHPTRGAVPPAEFVPLAEEIGHIVEIGRWVLAQATEQAAVWSREAGRPIGIAVNISPRQFADDDVVLAVRRALRASGLPAHQLTLEVTEGVLLRDVDAVVEQLRALRALGVRIAIDDFGTGYSSLSYLRRLPADIVKIDRSFVQELDGGGRSTTLVASIIELAQALHLEVVAEGVETRVQQIALESLACSHAQGFLFGRPLPAAEQHPGPARTTAVQPVAVAGTARQG
jgi:diguanylate cyclase (GGDEF)-like protein